MLMCAIGQCIIYIGCVGAHVGVIFLSRTV